MLIAQITDCHIVEPGELLNDRVDTATMLAAAVDHIERLSPKPDLVIATGDLVNDGTRAQYANLTGILDGLTIPVIAIPGNHDDRAELRRAFGLADADVDDRLDFVVEDFELALVALDTTIPGDHAGQVTAEQMVWLDHQLTELAPRPVLLIQHHPPFVTGIGWMDEVGLTGRELEADIVARHPHVQAVVCGHVHRMVQTSIGGAPASTWPSTGAQVALALDGTPHGYVDEPAAVALHHWSPEHGLISHVSYVDGPTPWLPQWALDEA